MEIDINKYLSEEDKIEIATSEFKQIVRKKVLEEFEEEKRTKNKYMSNYERIISNAIFYYLEGELDSLIGEDTKELIKKGVEKTIKSQKYEYSLFRKKDAWESEDSPAQAVVKEAIKEHSNEMKTKLKIKLDSLINDLDTDTVLYTFEDVFRKIIEEKLKA